MNTEAQRTPRATEKNQVWDRKISANLPFFLKEGKITLLSILPLS